MLSRNKETDVEVPYQEGGYFYYLRTEAGKQYGIRCRKKGSMDAPEEIVLDVNELAKGQKFMSLGAYDVSDDGNLLAYTADNTGFRQFTLAVKDLRTGKLLVDHAERVDSVARSRHTRLRRKGRKVRHWHRQNPQQNLLVAHFRQPHH